MDQLDITRRDVLAGVGVTGLAGAAGLAVGPGNAVAYTGSTQIVSNGITLDADWRETYNGEVIEDTRSAEWTADGPAVSLENVLPGDEGTFSFKLGVADPVSAPAELRLSFDITGLPENGVNEPERKANDTSEDEGELQNVVEAKFWRDEGVFDVDPLGGDNAVQEPTERLIPEGTEGTLAEVAAVFPDNGVSLGCLGVDETVTVSFGWEFAEPAGVDRNVTQGDGVSFDLEVLAQPCD